MSETAGREAVTVADLESLAMRLRGIVVCRAIWAADESVPSRVRLVCERARRAVAAHDVATAWFAAFGVNVPRERFVVTAVRSPADVGLRSRRFQFCDLVLDQRAEGFEVRVTLHRGGTIFTGSAVGPRGAEGHRLAGAAALAAVAQAVPALAGFALIDLQESVIAGHRYLVAALAVPERERGTSRFVLGVCLFRGDPREAAVRAVLDAVNRRLGRSD